LALAVSQKRYLVQTMGCQMNVHDSRRIEEVLREAGWEPTDEGALADLIVFNTCSVREKAEHKLMSALGTVRPFKMEREVIIAVAGCVAQQEGERLLKKAPFVDVVVGPDNIPELPALIEGVRSGSPPVARTVFDVEDPRFLNAIPRGREVTSFVTIMKGCDERCTFCVVPYTRGPERYRSADEIVSEIRAMVDGGVREVTLLGQTVNSWMDPREPETEESQFATLLRRIARDVPDLARLRYTSPHPRHLTDALIDAHAELSIVPRHVHLPVQSGSDRVLKRMLRRYTREHYLARIAKLRERVPDLTLSTDLIAGFPGETEAEFEETLSLIEAARFVAAFVFKYSPRPHTPALKLEDDVPEEAKDDRLQRALALIEKQQSAHLATLVGTCQEVLIEGAGRGDERRFTGRSARNEIVHVEVPEGLDPIGSLVSVEIAQAFKHSLLGRMEGAPIAERPAPRKRVLPIAKAAEC
jgi:tRNA-2-methylthio-N6-dimethylallyladenosine synthase